MCPGYPVTLTSTQVEMSTSPASAFCLCCFCQVVRCLWSLHVSRIPHHKDLHPSRKVYQTSWFILSVLFLTDCETSLVPRRVQIPITWISTRVGMSDQLVHFSVLFLTSGEMSVVPAHVWDTPDTRTSTPVGMFS